MGSNFPFAVEVDPESGLLVRPGTFDAWIINKESREYSLLGDLSGSRCLDVGGNVGAFVYRAAGARLVVSIEPDKENCLLLRENVRRMRASPQWGPTTEMGVKEAAVGTGNGQATLYLNNGRDKSQHSTVRRAGRDRSYTVPKYDFHDLVTDYQTDVVKVDIEGAEYDLNWGGLPPVVRRVAVEFHLTRKDWRNVRCPEIRQLLRDQGFWPLREKRIDTKVWAVSDVWVR